MAEYIKRDDAILRMCACFRFTQQMSRRILEAVPTADVVPRELYQRTLSDVVTLSAERKRGKWKAASEDLIICTSCKCGFLLPYSNRIEETKTVYGWNFCPNCGAQMEK